jgi:apolipoprotein N-acyltransferase
VPYQDELPFLRKDVLVKYLEFIETYDVTFWSDFYPGDSAALFEVGEYRFGPLICYEGVFPEYTRRMILNGADWLVNITNDSWWGHSVGLHMHSRFMVVRAIENRCWVVRAANSGWSYIIDDYGQTREILPLDAISTMTGRIDTIRDMSFFTRHGDFVGLLSFLISALLAAIFVVKWLIGKIMRR